MSVDNTGPRAGFSQSPSTSFSHEAGKSFGRKTTPHNVNKSYIKDASSRVNSTRRPLRNYAVAAFSDTHTQSALSMRPRAASDPRPIKQSVFTGMHKNWQSTSSLPGVTVEPLDLKNNLFLKAEGKELNSPPSFTIGNLGATNIFKRVALATRSIIRLKKQVQREPELDKQVLIGMENVASYKNQGIPRRYLEQSQRVANQEETIIAYRPVESIYRTLIEEGYASKGLNIKGKSSNWGPMAGFVPKDQFFSKLSGDPVKVTKYNQLNLAAIKQGHAVSEQLCISTKRLEELTSLGQLSDRQIIEPFGEYVAGLSFTSLSPNGSTEHFEAFQRQDDQWEIFSGAGSERKPLEVLPVIADFDLLFVHAKYESVDLGQQDRVQGFDKELGFISNRKKDVITALNDAFARGEDRNMVHHGADTHNPVSEMSINLPTTVFIPESMQSKMGIYKPKLI
ncbi:anthrax toxin-like adenylyl cyclase domain-containing protein [Endozoicomonas ascidiicola]|uniref:anthrax toxin-like adenylyl cyclase domain-containing protein n=1 Tax=Endozoicomonas ascidiicola TaxID=1698521 RepID=UPI00083427BD|nr:anthrax toxin-like adenylyl cyclase domain-containing protein [Endozoicomonas ascidiicola]